MYFQSSYLMLLPIVRKIKDLCITMYVVIELIVCIVKTFMLFKLDENCRAIFHLLARLSWFIKRGMHFHLWATTKNQGDTPPNSCKGALVREIKSPLCRFLLFVVLTFDTRELIVWMSIKKTLIDFWHAWFDRIDIYKKHLFKWREMIGEIHVCWPITNSVFYWQIKKKIEIVSSSCRYCH